MSEEENWDECFALEATLTPNRSKSTKTNTVLLGVPANSDDEEMWDDYFEQDVEIEGDRDKLVGSAVLVGRGKRKEDAASALLPESSEGEFLAEKLFEALETLMSKLQDLKPRGTLEEGEYYESSYGGAVVLGSADAQWKAQFCELQEQLQASTASGDKSKVSNYTWKLALHCRNAGMVLEAMNYFFELYQTLDPSGMQGELFTASRVHFQMGCTAYLLQDWMQAEISFKSAVNAAVYEADIEMLLNSYLAAASCLFKLERYLCALDFYQSFLNALLDARVSVDYWLPSVPRVLCDIGVAALKHSKSRLAYDYFALALQFDATLGPRWSNYAGVRTRVMQYARDSENLLTSPTIEAPPPPDVSEISSEFDDEESSWADISQDDKNEVNKLRGQLLFQENQQDGIDSVLLKCSILPPEGDMSVITVKYPKPSSLYSLRTAEGRTMMSEVEFEFWLRSIILSKFAVQLTSSVHRPWPHVFSHLPHAHLHSPNVSFGDLHLQCSRGSIEKHQFWNCISSIISGNSNQNNSNYNNNNSNYNNQNNSIINENEIYVLLDDCVLMWDKLYEEQWSNVLRYVASRSELDEVYVQILDAERCVNYYVEEVEVLRVWTAAYERVGLCHGDENAARVTLLKSRVLSDIVLYYNDRSPFDARARGEIGGEFDWDGTEYQDTTWLCNEELCVELLKQMYAEIPESRHKARAAHAMALYFQNTLADYETSERLHFECCMLLDRTKEFGVSALLSRFGSACLSGYGQALFFARKFRYAILAFEAAQQISAAMLDLDAYYKLARHVAQTIAHRPELSALAIEYYAEIGNAYLSQKRINEAVYVYETFCNYYLEQEQHESAFNALSKALRLFVDHETVMQTDTVNSSSTSRFIDPAYCRLTMRSVVILLSMGRYGQALQMIQRISQFQHSISYRTCINEWFVRVMLKRRVFSKTNELIDTWVETAQSAHLGDYVESQNRINNYRSLSCAKSFVSVDVLYHEFRARNFFNGNKFGAALEAIDTAIKLTPAERSDKLCKLYAIRGQVLECFCQKSPKFPLKMCTPLRKLYFERRSDLTRECIYSYREAYDYAWNIGDDDYICKYVTKIAQLHLEHLFWPVALNELSFNEAFITSFRRSKKFDLSSHNANVSNSNTKNTNPLKGRETLDAAWKIFESEKTSRNSKFLPNVTDDASLINDSNFISQLPNADFLRDLKEELDKLESMGDADDEDDVFSIDVTVGVIENASKLGLELSTDLHVLEHHLSGCLNMAELRYLQGKFDLALQFWNRFKDQFNQIFFDKTGMLFKSMPPSHLRRMLILVKRGVRFLMFQSRTVINNNLSLIDLLLHLERNCGQCTRESMYLFNLSGHLNYKNCSETESSEYLFSQKLPTHMTDDTSLEPNSSVKNAAFEAQNSKTFWNLYKYIRRQQRHYGEKKITREELDQRVVKSLRKIIRLSSKDDSCNHFTNEQSTESRVASNETSHSSHLNNIFYDEFLAQKHEILKKLAYVIQLDNRLIYYVPYTGDRRTQKLGRNQEKKFVVSSLKSQIYLTVHLLNQREYYVRLRMPLCTKLNNIMGYLFSIEFWTSPLLNENQTKLNPVLGGTTATESGEEELRIINLETKMSFYEEFGRMLDMIEPDSSIVTSEEGKNFDSSKVPISFVKISVESIALSKDLQVVPMHGRMYKTVFECFSHQELRRNSQFNPLKLYLYFSSTFKSTVYPFDRISKSVYFSENFQNFLQNQVGDHPEKNFKMQEMIQEMQTQFSPLLEILPLSNSVPSWIKLSKANSFKNKYNLFHFCKEYLNKDTTESVESNCLPLVLITTRWMQVIPWELFLPSVPLLRFLTIGQVYRQLNCTEMNKSLASEKIYKKFNNYSIVNWTYSENYRAVEKVKNQRIHFVMTELYSCFNLMQTGLNQQESRFNLENLNDAVSYNVENTGSLNDTHSTIFPFPSPTALKKKKLLIYKQKYKHVKFIDLSIQIC